MDRRRFLVGALAGGTALGLARGRARESGALPSAASADDKTTGVPSRRFAWQGIILCQFADARLMYDVQVVASRLGCRLDHGEPGSFDIFAVPTFITILDRTTMNRDMWFEYVSVRKEVGDETLCVLVDSLGKFEGLPMDDHMVVLDPRIEADRHAILGFIRQEHERAQAWQPEDMPPDDIPLDDETEETPS